MLPAEAPRGHIQACRHCLRLLRGARADASERDAILARGIRVCYKEELERIEQGGDNEGEPQTFLQAFRVLQAEAEAAGDLNDGQ